MKPQIIAFLGTVGAGKSTHMRLLYLKLKSRGFKTKLTYLKTGHLLVHIFEICLARIVASKRKDVYPIRAVLEERPTLFRRIFRLWLGLDLISVTLKFLVNIYLFLRLGYIIHVEDYIPATISDYIYLSTAIGSPLKLNSFAINYLLRLMKLCTLTRIVFLDAEDDELKKRWKLRRSLDERKDYLQMQRTLLLQMSRVLSSNGLIYVNTSSRTLRETQELITSGLLALEHL